MKIQLAWRYLFGSEKAIQEIAKDPSAILSGIILVLTAAIARNYDQIFIGEQPARWILGSLLFSYISALFLFSAVYYGFARRELRAAGREFNSFRAFPSFLGLFWMTAPLAWLYAVPFERFLDAVPAAKANVVLLAIVSIWRVLLMARVLAVLLNAAFSKMLMWVLAPASLEAFVLAAISDNVAKSIMAAMSGIRNAPDQEVLMDAVGAVTLVSPVVFLVGLVGALVMSPQKQIRPLPSPTFSLRPPGCPVVVLAVWTGIAVTPQRELSHNHQVALLVSEKRYRQALDYLSNHEPQDFAPAKRIAPDPYEYEIREHLPPLLRAMDGAEKPWVRRRYFSYFLILLEHRLYHGHQAESVYESVEALAKIPEARPWIERNKEEIQPAVQEAYALLEFEEPERLEAFNTLRSLGLSPGP